jgi:DNA-binding NarL/FixJ family response regulator
VERKPVRVLIVDDHALFADALKFALDRTPEVEVVGIAVTGPDAVDLALLENADVVLMDVTLPGFDGFEAARRLLALSKTAKVLAMTSYSEDEVAGQLRACGMVGYLSKSGINDTVLPAILAAAAPHH